MTTTNIHGHEILHLIAQAQPPLSRAALHAEVARRFGAAARFCTCSATEMALDELLAFLLSRGKIVEQDGRLAADLSQMCSDGQSGGH